MLLVDEEIRTLLQADLVVPPASFTKPELLEWAQRVVQQSNKLRAYMLDMLTLSLSRCATVQQAQTVTAANGAAAPAAANVAAL